MMNRLAILLAIAVLIFVAFFCISCIVRSKEIEAKKEERRKKRESQTQNGTISNQRGIINKLNNSKIVNSLGLGNDDNGKMQKIFNRAKNPWRMTIATFQFVRFGGLAACIFIAGIFALVSPNMAMLMLGLGFICVYYPLYYYKATGDEREAEWNKMYEFVWVIKHNIMLYDPAKAYINTKIYIEEHAPHNKEIIQGFEDFYKYWNTEEIDPYIVQYYPFSVTREITQIIYNMNKTGDFPEDSLNALRGFIINAQDLTVEKTLSGVSGKATIFSLPFMMLSVIVALLVPMIFQLTQYL